MKKETVAETNPEIEKKKEKNIRLFERFSHSRYQKKAEDKLEDPAYLENLTEKSGKLGGIVKKAGERVRILIDYLFGKDSDIGSKIYTIAALIYFISPVDFLPDFIPGLGFLDDLAILGMIAGAIISKIAAKEKDAGLADIVRQTLQTTSMRKDLRNDKLLEWLGMDKRSSDQKALLQTGGARSKMDPAIRRHLIIVIISLAGAIIAAGVALVLKFYFKVF